MRSLIFGISASRSDDEYLDVLVGTDDDDPLVRLVRSVRYFDKVEDGTKLDE